MSSILHLAGAAAALLAAPHLLRHLGVGRELRLAAQVHVFCIALLLTTSGSYHAAMQLFGAHDPLTVLLVRLDHCAVWVLLAGFFLLPHLIAQRGAWRWAPLAVVGAAASLGISSKVFFYVDQTPAEIVIPYALASLVGLGSTVKFVSQGGLRASGLLFGFWIAFGSAAVCFVLRVPVVVEGWIGPHEVWHVGILAGIYAHWRFVLQLAPEAATAFPGQSAP